MVISVSSGLADPLVNPYHSQKTLGLVEHYSDFIINFPYFKFKLLNLREVERLNNISWNRYVVCVIFLTTFLSCANVKSNPQFNPQQQLLITSFKNPTDNSNRNLFKFRSEFFNEGEPDMKSPSHELKSVAEGVVSDGC